MFYSHSGWFSGGGVLVCCVILSDSKLSVQRFFYVAFLRFNLISSSDINVFNSINFFNFYPSVKLKRIHVELYIHDLRTLFSPCINTGTESGTVL